MAHDPRLVERVARALAGAGLSDAFKAAYIDQRWHHFRADATAALDAIEAAGCVVVPAPKVEPVSGCHVDIFDTITGMPDECVLDTGSPNDCVYAARISCREQCKYWKVVTPQSVEEAGGTWRPELLEARLGITPRPDNPALSCLAATTTDVATQEQTP